MIEHDAELLWALQHGIPLEPRPFARLGELLGLSEAALLKRLKQLIANGTIRRFGGVFDSRRLGYRSVLCAMTLNERELDEVVPHLIPQPGITHCYLRAEGGEAPGAECERRTPNLWFTFAALAERFERQFDALKRAAEPHAVLALPALRRFKIDVVFDPRTRDDDETAGLLETFPVAQDARAEAEVSLPFSAKQKQIVREMQGAVPIVAEPFAAIADRLELPVTELLAQVREWSASGVLRRLGAVVRHQTLGFHGNGMCVWLVPAEQALMIGRRLATFAEVTHCYERPAARDFPYNMYAMIHAATPERARRLFERIAAAAELGGGTVLLSVREYKKSSMAYFNDENEE